jgi:flagellar hook-basal body complex protein FliE
VDAISSLPSLNDLLRQNPNLQPNVLANKFSGENQSFNAEKALSVPPLAGAPNPTQIDKTSPTERVTAPGFADMFEKFVKGVDQKKKISAKETQDLILGRSDNIHEAVVKSQEAGVAFNLMIEVRNKLVESYKELMRMSV